LNHAEGIRQGFGSRDLVMPVQIFGERYPCKPLIARVVFDKKDPHRLCLNSSIPTMLSNGALHDSPIRDY
jgi:hypothetical protein